MGLRDWWNARVFDVVDFFTTSDVEAQRNEYKKLVKYMNKKVPELDRAIGEMEGSYATLTSSLSGAQDTASSGGLVDRYSQKYTLYDTRTTALIQYYKDMRDAMKQKQAEAVVQLEVYEELVRIENERKAEIARQEAEAAAAAAANANK